MRMQQLRNMPFCLCSMLIFFKLNIPTDDWFCADESEYPSQPQYLQELSSHPTLSKSSFYLAFSLSCFASSSSTNSLLHIPPLIFDSGRNVHTQFVYQYTCQRNIILHNI